MLARGWGRDVGVTVKDTELVSQRQAYSGVWHSCELMSFVTIGPRPVPRPATVSLLLPTPALHTKPEPWLRATRPFQALALEDISIGLRSLSGPFCRSQCKPMGACRVQ